MGNVFTLWVQTNKPPLRKPSYLNTWSLLYILDGEMEKTYLARGRCWVHCTGCSLQLLSLNSSGVSQGPRGGCPEGEAWTEKRLRSFLPQQAHPIPPGGPETSSPLGSPPPLISKGRGPVPPKYKRKLNHWHGPSPTAKELERFSVFFNFLVPLALIFCLLPVILPAAFLILPYLLFFMLFTSCWAPT